MTDVLALQEDEQRLIDLGKADDQCDLCLAVGTTKIEARGTKVVWTQGDPDRKGKPTQTRKIVPMQVCQNVDTCHDFLVRTLRRDDKLAKMIDGGFVPDRFLDRQYRPRNKKEAVMTKATPTKPGRARDKNKAPGVCEFSGEECKPGSKFRPGYDAKLKSALGKLALDGDVEAQMEIDLRGWPPRKGTSDDIINAAADRFQEIGDTAARQAWLRKRIDARLAAIAKGVDPLDAVAGRKSPSKAKPKAKKAA